VVKVEEGELVAVERVGEVAWVREGGEAWVVGA
jgi:hypothetical protein